MSGIPYQQPGTAYTRKRLRGSGFTQRATKHRQRFIGPIQRPRSKIYKQPRIRHSGDLGNNMGSCVVALHQLQTLDLTPGADAFFCPQLPVELIEGVLEQTEEYCDLSFDRPEGFSSHRDVMNFLYKRAKFNLFRV
jgi:hypothetical protein